MSADPELRIADESATSETSRHCLNRYYAELRQRFPEGFDPANSVLHSLDEFDPPRGAFLIMTVNGQPVGCGGMTPLDDGAAYLKRMWVAPEARGSGLGRKLLAALEEKAAALGYRTVKLETHRTLAEAQKLYASSGYTEMRPFNNEPYAHHWYEKSLA